MENCPNKNRKFQRKIPCQKISKKIRENILKTISGSLFTKPLLLNPHMTPYSKRKNETLVIFYRTGFTP